MRTILILAASFLISTAAFAQDVPASIIKPGTPLEKVVTDLKFTEGPVWMPEGFLVFSDIPADTVYNLGADGKVTPFLHPSGHSNGLAVTDTGQLLLCLQDRCLARLEPKANPEDEDNLTVLAATFEKKPLNSPNDLTVDKKGAIYFTDPPYGIKAQDAKLGFCGIYRWSQDKGLELMDKSINRPNGIALSNDGKKLYVSDSEANFIQVFDVDDDGYLGQSKRFADLKTPDVKGAADGLKVDSAGDVVATGPGGVWFFSPDGKLLGKLAVPEVTTNLAFGGPGRKTLYITAGKSLYRIPVKIGGIEPEF
jgi:gluconolactonase